jgi:hypothetical protein
MPGLENVTRDLFTLNALDLMEAQNPIQAKTDGLGRIRIGDLRRVKAMS